ncbi:hypothetical protein B0H13DRAFT_1856462 [Mycena leptocephala]|nr:hypothetical protein B0H13DRAFT_1856462 [Mycena leptocephala]
MKRPTDLKKCDFYPTSRSMTLFWVARVLDCWRLVLGCDTDLLSHFDELAAHGALPTLDDLLEQASILRERYACQSAYEQSLDQSEQENAAPRRKFPQGSAWTVPCAPEPTPESAPESAPEPDADDDMPDLQDIPEDPADGQQDEAPADVAPAAEPKQDEGGPKVHEEIPGFDGDRVLSNAILFLMEYGWWIELNYAIAEGDVGRVFEILKCEPT